MFTHDAFMAYLVLNDIHDLSRLWCKVCSKRVKNIINAFNREPCFVIVSYRMESREKLLTTIRTSKHAHTRCYQ